jgi:hypothetical protein
VAEAYRVIVTGCRSWTDREAVERAFVEHVGSRVVAIIHGACATGADAIADEYAEMIGAEVERHRADWNKYGKSAGRIRNVEMSIAGADLCLAFWDGNSRDTRDMIEQATRAGIPVRIIPKTATPAPGREG